MKIDHLNFIKSYKIDILLKKIRSGLSSIEFEKDFLEIYAINTSTKNKNEKELGLRIIKIAYTNDIIDHNYANQLASKVFNSNVDEIINKQVENKNKIKYNKDSKSLTSDLPHGRTNPKISIITPSYNQGQYIEETILSVINQDYSNFEYIIIDGGSTDETINIINQYKDKIDFFISEKDKGQSDALNKGFKQATGEILCWINSDDQLSPGALNAVAMAFATNEVDMVAGVLEVYENGTMIERHMTSCEDGELPLMELLDLDNRWNIGQFFYQPEVFFSKKIWEKSGGFVKTDCFYSMDYELWLRFAFNKAKLHVIGRSLAIS